jgi:hypothetical protein
MGKEGGHWDLASPLASTSPLHSSEFVFGGEEWGAQFYFFQKGQNLVFSVFLVTKFGRKKKSLKLPDYSSKFLYTTKM